MDSMRLNSMAGKHQESAINSLKYQISARNHLNSRKMMIPAWENSGFQFNLNLIFLAHLPSHLRLSPSSSWHCSGRSNPSWLPPAFPGIFSGHVLQKFRIFPGEFSPDTSLLSPLVDLAKVLL